MFPETRHLFFWALGISYEYLQLMKKYAKLCELSQNNHLKLHTFVRVRIPL